mmetsp:Transcript_5542/g.6898  ORF Transcript_5542/g.6898 Transcript_5542/m.6898 type:complete len:374 (-) Transcript_5542:116-1237(-)
MNLFLGVSYLFGAALASSPSPHSLSTYDFSQYVIDFHKNYQNENELNIRKEIFLSKRNEIIKHNNLGLSWTENVNEFTDETKLEEKSRKGLNKAMLYESRSKKAIRQKTEPTLRNDLPESVDWRTQGVVTAVKNQGGCGSCWAFGATEALESHIAIETGLLFTLSEQEFVSCVENPDMCGGKGGCKGATPQLAFQYAMDNGLVTQWEVPYTSYTKDVEECPLNTLTPKRVATISNYVDIATNSYIELMNAIAFQGPISLSVDASQWSSYSSGIFNGCDQVNPDLDHAVLLVGYGTDEALKMDYWLVRNSWGPAWGEQGYIRLARLSNEDERCGLDLRPNDGSACRGVGPDNITVCGTCGILYDNSYPTGGSLS